MSSVDNTGFDQSLDRNKNQGKDNIKSGEKSRSKNFKLDVNKVRLCYSDTDIPDGWKLVATWTDETSSTSTSPVTAKGLLKSFIHSARGNCGLYLREEISDTVSRRNWLGNGYTHTPRETTMYAIPALILPQWISKDEEDRLLKEFLERMPQTSEGSLGCQFRWPRFSVMFFWCSLAIFVFYLILLFANLPA